MTSTSVIATLFLLSLAVFHPTVQSTYIENIAANVDGSEKSSASSSSASSSTENKRRHEPFVPMVAFLCDHRNKFMNKEGEWQDDPSSAATCLQNKHDILKYCQRVYPNEKITNFVEYAHHVHIDNWCREDGTHCSKQHVARPYRCIVGEFVTESLQVPSKCHFNHIAGGHNCNDYNYWNKRAEEECDSKVGEGQPMKLRSFAILEPCGLSMFRGVEYVCCPKSVEEKIEKVVDLEKDADEDDYDDDEEEEPTGKKGGKEDKAGQDPYFNEPAEGELDATTEHERFREAEERLERKHRKKVTKVITEWSELFERYNKMREKDAKGAEEYKREMTARFRKTVAALEAENKEQRAQIEEVHDERIQNILNEKKRKATHEYRAALAMQVGTSNKNNVLRTLKNYIKAEEKDRAHMLNRYRHLLRSDPEQAATFEPVLLHRLRYIDLRVNGTLAMLHDFPAAIEFWVEYRRENTPDVSDSGDAVVLLGGEEQNERLIRLYKQAFERNHPGIVAFIEEHNKKKKTAASTSRPVVHQTVVRLKDILKEKVRDELPEDSDEDQFEEDEDSDKKTSLSTSKGSSSSSSSSSADKKEAALDKKKALNLLKSMKPWKVELEGDEDGSAKVLPLEETGKGGKKKTVTLDEDPDDEEESDEEGEEPAKKGRKTLAVSIEPIVSASKYGKDVKIDADAEEEPSAYSRQDVLVVDVEKIPSQQSWASSWSSQTNVAIALMLSALVILMIGLFVRRRSRHPGFIEVDICTPEERHVNGMQVNGYENPTYSFFDSAKA